MDHHRSVFAVIIALLAGAALAATQGPPAFVYTGTAPSGACFGDRVWIDALGTGTYYCNAGTWTKITVTASPGGSNTQVQYNSSGSLAGSPSLTWTTGTTTLTAANVSTGKLTTTATLGSTGVQMVAGSVLVLGGAGGSNIGSNGGGSSIELNTTGGDSVNSNNAFNSAKGSGGNAFSMNNAGARVKFSLAGTNDYLYADSGNGYRITTPGAFRAGALTADSLVLVTTPLAATGGGTGLATMTGANRVLISTDASTLKAEAMPSCSGATDKLLYNSGTSAFACGTDAGGSGAPGGATTQIQYNNNGAFAGSVNLTYNTTSQMLTLGDPTVTSSGWAKLTASTTPGTGFTWNSINGFNLYSQIGLQSFLTGVPGDFAEGHALHAIVEPGSGMNTTGDTIGMDFHANDSTGTLLANKPRIGAFNEDNVFASFKIEDNHPRGYETAVVKVKPELVELKVEANPTPPMAAEPATRFEIDLAHNSFYPANEGGVQPAIRLFAQKKNSALVGTAGDGAQIRFRANDISGGANSIAYINGLISNTTTGRGDFALQVTQDAFPYDPASGYELHMGGDGTLKFWNLNGGAPTLVKDLLAASPPAGSTGQVQYNNGGVAGGLSRVEGDGADLRLVDTATHSTTPAAGKTTLASYQHFGANGPGIPQWVNGALGFDVHPFPSTIGEDSYWGCATAPGFGYITAPYLLFTGHFPPTTVTGSANITNWASTSLITRIPWTQTAGAGAINTPAGWRTITPSIWRGNSAGAGGFLAWSTVQIFFSGAANTTQRVFFGLRNAATALTASADPSAALNTFYFGTDAAGDANMDICSNDGTGTATCTDLGANFPTRTNLATFDIAFWAAPNDTSISYFIRNVATGATATGSKNTKLPVNTAQLGFEWNLNSGSTTNPVTLRISRACFIANP